MGSLDATAKAVLLRFLPDAFLLPIKRVRYILTVRSFWSPEVAHMVRLVEAGDHVLDIGAHADWYTRVLSKVVGPGGRVYSFEPQTFALLEFCVRSLKLRNVTLFNLGTSRENGRRDDGARISNRRGKFLSGLTFVGSGRFGIPACILSSIAYSGLSATRPCPCHNVHQV